MRRQIIIAVFVLGASAPTAGAQELPPVHYDAPATCPGRDVFVEHMRARVAADGVRALTSLTLHVRIQRPQPGQASVRGDLRIERDGASALRTLEGATCKEVVEGLALIAALAVATPARTARTDAARVRGDGRDGRDSRERGPERDGRDRSPERVEADRESARARADGEAAPARPDGKAAPARPDGKAAPARPDGKGTPAPADGEAAPARADGKTAADRADGKAAADRADGAAALDRVAAGAAGRSRAAASSARAEPVRAPPPSAAAGASAAEPGSPRERDADPARPTADRYSPAWSAGAAFLGLHGLAPGLQPGLQLQAAARIAGGWSVRLAARLALEDAQRNAGGIARFGFAGGALQLCASGAFGESALGWEGCAVAEPGVLSARGDDTQNPRSYERGWLGLGVGAGLGWRAGRWLVLRAGAEALVPMRRDRMILAGEALHRVPPVCLRLQVALDVPLG